MRPGDRVSVGGAIVLLAVTLATRWYGVIEPPSHAGAAGVQSSAGAWSELHTIRWLLVATAVAALIRPVLARIAVSAGRVGNALEATLAWVASISLFVRVLVDPPAPGSVDDIKLGAYLALLSTLTLAVGTGYHRRAGWGPERKPLAEEGST